MTLPAGFRQVILQETARAAKARRGRGERLVADNIASAIAGGIGLLRAQDLIRRIGDQRPHLGVPLKFSTLFDHRFLLPLDDRQ